MAKTLSPIVAAIVAADKAAGTMFSACGKAADLLAAQVNTANKQSDEYKRLMTEAKSLVSTEGVKLAQERNVWLFVGQALLVRMVPDQAVVVGTSGKGKEKAITLKPASECKTAREVAAASKAIRESIGLADGRANNAPKTEAKPEAPKDEKAVAGAFWDMVVAVLAVEKDRARLFDLLKASGYAVTRNKVAKTPVKTAKRSAMASTAAQAGILPVQPSAVTRNKVAKTPVKTAKRSAMASTAAQAGILPVQPSA